VVAEPTCPVCASEGARPERKLNGFQLLRCSSCSMVYVWPRPSREGSRESYASGQRGDEAGSVENTDPADLMLQYDQEHTAYIQHALKKRLSRIAGSHTIRTMLDFGCGSGHLLGLAKTLFGCETVGVEVNLVARLGADRFGFHLHDGPLDSLVPPEDGFDLIYSGQVFEHLPEPTVELRILARMLAPQGVLFIEVPNYDSLSIVVGRDSFISNTPPGHLNFFTASTLARLVADQGLSIASRRTTGLNYRALLGLEAVSLASRRLPGVTRGPDTGSISIKERTKLQVLGILDSFLSIPGWGMQAAVIATSAKGSTRRAYKEVGA